VLVHDYVSGLSNADQLLDMVIEGREQRVTTGKGQLFYPEVRIVVNKTHDTSTSFHPSQEVQLY
jgi:hypothetical protein